MAKKGEKAARVLAPKEAKGLIDKVKRDLKAKGPRTRELPGLTPEARHFVVKESPFDTREVPLDSITIEVRDPTTGAVLNKDYGPPPDAHLCKF